MRNAAQASSSFIGNINPIRYRGYYYDTDLGLYYLQSRYYDPETGRFVSVDNQISTGDTSGLNLFAYCSNDPVNNIDPTGEAWYHWALGAVVVAACAVAVVATAGGAAAGLAAIAAVGSGMAAATTASTIAAGAFIGAATVLGIAAVEAAASSSSVQEFNDRGNWGTVASTAGGAVLGGVGAYWGSGGASSRSSSSMPKVKVKAWVKNDVIDLPRIGSALKNDTYHSFSNVIDNYVGYANKSVLNNATLYQLQGSLNGVAGRFEWIVQNQQVTHRMFVPGGGVNGIPIMP